MTTTTDYAPLTDAEEEETSRYADLGWTTIHYNDIGSGDPVVLVHGGRLGATSWSNFTLNIRPLAAHFRVLAMDMPGFGKSAHWADGGRAGATENARAVAEVLDQIGIEKTHVLGNSMGGATALTFMVDYPEKTKKVIAMGPAPIGQRVWSTPGGFQDSSGTDVVRDPSPETWRRFYEGMVYDLSIVPPEVLQKRMDSIKDPHQDQHRLNRLAAMQRGRGPGGGGGGGQRSIVDKLADVETPVLFIQGRNDTIVPPAATIMLMAWLQNAELHLFNKCGHWAQYEHADRFNALALDFLLND